MWEKRSDRARNEPLDIRNYATAALEIKSAGLPYDLLEYIAEQDEAIANGESRPVGNHTENNNTPEKKVVKFGAEKREIKRRKTSKGVNPYSGGF